MSGNNKKGFTFVEVMLSLGIMVIMLISINEVFTAGIGLWKRSGREDIPADQARALEECLGKDLRNAMPGKTFPFIARQDKISFYSKIRDSENKDLVKPAYISYIIRREEHDKYSLIRICKNLFSGDKSEDVILAGNLKNFVIRFLYQKKWSKIQYDWMEVWDEKMNLPGGMRFEYEITDSKAVKAEKFTSTILIPAGTPGLTD